VYTYAYIYNVQVNNCLCTGL